MKLIRKLLVRTIGIKAYLRTISSTYIKLIRFGAFKSKYQEIHFLKSIIREDDVCVDIGANLGYYSSQLANLASNGKVIAIEPIPMFAEIWRKNVKAGNAVLHEVALGNEQKTVEMVLPVRDGVVRHGLTKVIDDTTEEEAFLTFAVEMKTGNDVLGALDKIDFLKCDVEGYEMFVFQALNEVLEQHKPMVQVELNGEENRASVYEQLRNSGYEAFVLQSNGLHPVKKDMLQKYSQDFYFIHPEKIDKYCHFIVS